MCVDAGKLQLVTETANQCADRQAAAVTKVVRSMEIDVELCESKRALDAETTQLKLDLAKDYVEKATPWYTHPAFVAASSVTLTLLTIYAARETIVDVR